MLRFAIFACSLSSVTIGCILQGYDSGVCEDYSLEGFKGQLEFCGDKVTYRACMPAKPPSSSEDLNDHTKIEKDKWVAEQYAIITEWYKGNHTGHDGKTSANADCMSAFKNFMCWYNFPRCSNLDVSLVMCRTVCENMMIACGITKTSPFWRCGDPQYMNGLSPEVSESVDQRGYKVWKRDFFPGQPFRDYRETDEGDPIVVCTPSILGAASDLGSITYARASLRAAILASFFGLIASFLLS